MEKLYYNLDEPTAFSSHGPLRKQSGKPSRVVQKFLEDQHVYSKHKQLRYKFTRRRTYGDAVFSHIQGDLIEMGEFSRSNRDFRYALSLIDCFSRFAWTIPIKRKTGENMVEALKEVFEKRARMFPTYLVCDKGREFTAAVVKRYLESRNILLIHPESEIKCAMIERFNRTWQTRLHKYFTYTNSVRWLDSGEKITNAINKSYHRMIKCTPEDVFTGKKQPADQLLRMTTVKSPKYKIGQMVRMSRTDEVFRKGYRSGWTNEEFQIISALSGSPPVYRLVDLSGEEILGIVYEQELVKAV